MAASTVVAVIGDDTEPILADLSALRNVEAFAVDRDDDGETAAARRIVASHAPYVLSDADPLAHVASAWVEFFGDRSTLGTLRIEAAAAASSLRAGAVQMPDYYLVLEPESIEGTWRHWWFGALSRRAPTRVIPLPGSAGAVHRQLRGLPMAKPWGAIADWLDTVQFEVPDRPSLV